MTPFTLITCSLAFACLASAQELRWGTLTPLPIAITNNAVTGITHEGVTTLYSFMGMTNPTQPSSATVASYALTVGVDAAWRRIADVPLLNGNGKIGASAVAVGDSVYVIGGYTITGASEVTEKRFYRYNPALDTYTRLADVPTEVDDTVAGVYLDRYIYLASGWHGPAISNTLAVQVYDTVTDSWSQCTPLPGPGAAPTGGLFGHMGTIVDGRIIVADGVKLSPGFVMSNAVYSGKIDPMGAGDVTAIAWEVEPAHPQAPSYRAGASQGAAIINATRGMLVIGGAVNPYNYSGTGYNGSPALPRTAVFFFEHGANATTGTWSVITPPGTRTRTMDHRGLVPVRIGAYDGYATIGGMTAAGVATSIVNVLIVDACAIDFNRDGVYPDMTDLADFVRVFGGGTCAPVCDDIDFDKDGVFPDMQDVLAFLDAFGTGC